METVPRHDGVLAAVDYCDVAKSLVYKLKYGRKPGASRVMADFMYRHAQRHPQSALVPVPLHRIRLWTRGFSQIYVSIGDVDANGGLSVRAYDKPLVLLIWLGALVMASGGALSLSDRRRRIGAPNPAKAKLASQPAPAE